MSEQSRYQPDLDVVNEVAKKFGFDSGDFTEFVAETVTELGPEVFDGFYKSHSRLE